jgi:hypothetical protein
LTLRSRVTPRSVNDLAVLGDGAPAPLAVGILVDLYGLGCLKSLPPTHCFSLTWKYGGK